MLKNANAAMPRDPAWRGRLIGAAVVLLVAIVAAVALTLRKRKDTKHFAPGDAVRVKRNDRLKIIKMDAVVERPAAEPEVKEAP